LRRTRQNLPDGGRAVRDTRDKGAGPILLLTAAERRAFVAGVKDGELDQPRALG
jgi:hypothetical protein